LTFTTKRLVNIVSLTRITYHRLGSVNKGKLHGPVVPKVIRLKEKILHLSTMMKLHIFSKLDAN
jgi:hypothetical protein